MKKILKAVLVLFSLCFLTSNFCDAQKDKNTKFKLTKYNKSMEISQDKGITSPIHEKYVRKLVFSSTPFENGVENESEFKNEFTSNDNIYIRAYMPHSVMNHPVFAYQKGGESPKKNIYGEYYYKVTIDGAPLLNENYEFAEDQVSGDQDELTVLSSAFLPAPSTIERDHYLLDALNNLALGDHVVKLEMHTSSGGYDSREPLCTGEFIYKKTGNEEISVGKSWSQFNAGMKDENLEAQMLEMMKKFAQREGWNAEIGGVKIVDSDWNMERNEITGIILDRWVAVNVYIKYNDGVCQVRRFIFQQNHNGNGFSNNLSHNGGGKFEKIDCD
jgi:hypothetical protein